ncbi:ABC transporter permease [Streptomyces uncialis]|uniref:ABC transporter permease n=1 Tax=Streptomyces uncialis TaxID=1048205 RepID=UPI00382EAB28
MSAPVLSPTGRTAGDGTPNGSAGEVRPAAAYRTVLRLHRRGLRFLAALVALATAVVIGVYLWWRFASDRDECRDARGDIRIDTECFRNSYGYVNADSWYRTLGDAPQMWLLLPVVLAVLFAAGPLIARELESGTYRMAWTQSQSPASWLTARLVVGGAVAAGTAVAVTALYRLVWETHGDLMTMWDQDGVFRALGPALTAYALLAVALGALAGLLVRRVLMAMSLGLLATGVVLGATQQLRFSLWPTVSQEWQGKQGVTLPDHSSDVDSGMLTASGDRKPSDFCMPSGYYQQSEYRKCLADNNVTGSWIEYHPPTHFWPLQLVETGLVLALTAVTVFAAYRVLRRIAP